MSGREQEMKQKAEQHRRKTLKTFKENNDNERAGNGKEVHPLIANKKFSLQIIKYALHT